MPHAYEPATLEDGTPVPASELAVAMCDCDITRIVVDAEGAPVDLGRTQRLFSGSQRRAVIARDRGCIWPGCRAPARWCEIHHTEWWDRDRGRTRVDLGVLMCSFHHHETHRRDVTITRRPADRTPGRRPDGSVARARYRLTDPSGRPVGGASHSPPAGPAPPDPPALEWMTDPVTGMRTAAWPSPGGAVPDRTGVGATSSSG